MQISSLPAGWEQREDESRLQKNLADQDFFVGEQERKISVGGRDIAEQELVTAGLLSHQQKAIADYRATKFLNRDLYEWMSRVLGDVNAILLQQATTVALPALQRGTLRSDFPPGLDDLCLQQVVLCLVSWTVQPAETEVLDLRLTPQGGDSAGGAARSSSECVISTRRASGSVWLSLLRSTPVGRWRNRFEQALAAGFGGGSVTDVVLVLTFTGRTPPWPAW